MGFNWKFNDLKSYLPFIVKGSLIIKSEHFSGRNISEISENPFPK